MQWIANMEKWVEMSFEQLLRGRQGTEGDGIDLSLKQPQNKDD